MAGVRQNFHVSEKTGDTENGRRVGEVGEVGEVGKVGPTYFSILEVLLN